MSEAWTTVVEREPEWDDDTRGRALRLTEWEDDLCRCGCGRPMAEAHDPTSIWLVDKFTCFAGRALDRVKREEREAKKDTPDGWDDGMHYFVREPTQQELDRQPPAGRGGDARGH